jgi:protein involved in polysaccharide export with SLBB domain
VRQVVLGRANPLPQCRSLATLQSLVRDAQAQRFSAVTRGAFVVQTGAGADIGASGAALGVSAGQSVERFARTAADVAPPVCPAVFEADPELLPFVLEHAVSVGGAVRRPGAYPIAGQVTARDMTLVAEGLILGNRDLVLDINRTQQSAPERISADLSGTVLAITTLAPGDDIRFNAEQAAFESSGVLLSGEVARPGLYAIRRGERLSELIARAGGLTTQAYAFGAVFTRESVRRSQEEGFRRTARELYSGMLAITARNREGGSTEGLAGAVGLIQALATAEAPGRMVVEADPRVLEIRPDLDTILEGGDAIFLPKRPNFVLALGDVNNPGALQHVPGKPASDYLREAGGTSSTADNGRIFMILPNGTAQPVSTRGWGGTSGQSPPPGSTLIVPKNLDPLFRLTVVRDITAIVAQLATSVATVAVLATR